MNHPKIALFSLAVLFALLIAGCNAISPDVAATSSPESAASISPSATPVSSEPDVSASPTVDTTLTPSPELTPSAADKVSISVTHATAEILGNYDSYTDEYVELEYSIRIIISTNTAAKDFKYFTIGNREENSNIVFFVNQVLYSTDELLPEKPLVIGTEFPGTLPTIGISFTDENNTTRYFTVNESGMDGSLFITEFQPV